MKNKKIIIGVVILTLVMIVSIVTLKNVQETKVIVDIAYNMFSGDVDAGSSYLLDSEIFESMSKSDKIEKTGELLNLYQNEGLINNLYYDETGEMYTFTYGDGDIEGAFGGVSLKEWNPMMN